MKMKTKFLIITIIMFMMICIASVVHAAPTASIKASKTSATVGDSVTITVTAHGATWDLYLGGAINDNYIFGDSEIDYDVTKTKNFKLDTSVAGTYTINLTGTVNDENLVASTINDSVTVNVKEKQSNTNTNTDTNTNNNTGKNTTTNNNTNKNTNTNTEVIFSNASGTVYATQDINLRGSATTKKSNVIKSLAKGTEMTIKGKSTSKVDGYYWYKVSVNGTVGYVATSLVTTTKPKEDEKPTLKSLTINSGKLSPAFSKTTTTYNLSVESDVDQITVKAVGDSGVTIKITCNGSTISNGVVPINEGLNTVKIQATKGGESNTYTVYIRKSIEEDNDGNIREDDTDKEEQKIYLKSLEIVGLNISPEFDKNIYSYTLEIPEDDDRTSLDIKAVANVEDAKVEIVDNENLEYGENIITIMVKSKDGKETAIYQLVVNKLQPTTTLDTTSGNIVDTTKGIVAENKLPVIIICILIVLAIICIIFIIKTAKKEDDFERQLEEDEEKKDILDTDIQEEAYETNQYLNELRKKEDEDSEETEQDSEKHISEILDKPRRGRHF